jgi:beta-RFAP synthase
LRIETPSRLHFGLLGWGRHARRQFGGLGLMIDRPGLEMVVEPHDRWEATGSQAARSLEVARDLASTLAARGHPVGPLRITHIRIPTPHTGLGVGTQLSLAVGRALTEFAGRSGVPALELAALVGRGRRSGIGLHGFDRGGLIVDGGRSGPNDIPPLIARLDFPREWWTLVVVPEVISGLHGQDEVRAFHVLPDMPPTHTDRLCRLVLLDLLPAVAEADLGAFGTALGQIQQLVGEAFAPVQGGCFARPETAALAHTMTDLGLKGVGQSSWGPALYGFSADGPERREEARRALIARHGLSEQSVIWTTASTHGATVLWESPVGP